MAVTAIPQWLLARSGSVAIVITPVTVVAAGTTTEVTGSAATVTGVIRSISVKASKNVRELSPSTQTRENDVIISTRSDIDMEVLVPATGVAALNDIAAAYDLVKIVYTRGGTAHAWTHYGPIINIEEGFQDKGEVLVRMTVGMSGTNDTNPLYGTV